MCWNEQFLLFFAKLIFFDRFSKIAVYFKLAFIFSLKICFVLKTSLFFFFLAQTELRDELPSAHIVHVPHLLSGWQDTEVTGFVQVQPFGAPAAFPASCIGRLEHRLSAAEVHRDLLPF